MTDAKAQAMARLAQLCEECRGGTQHEDWRGRWWAKLPIDARRMVAVIAGVDDSEATVKRPWMSLSVANRESISNTARDWARMLEPMRYA